MQYFLNEPLFNFFKVLYFIGTRLSGLNLGATWPDQAPTETCVSFQIRARSGHFCTGINWNSKNFHVEWKNEIGMIYPNNKSFYKYPKVDLSAFSGIFRVKFHIYFNPDRRISNQLICSLIFWYQISCKDLKKNRRNYHFLIIQNNKQV